MLRSREAGGRFSCFFKNKGSRRTVPLLLLLLWCVAIFNFTEQPVFNDEHSLKLFSMLGLSEAATDIIDFIARKLAHAAIFSLLAYLALKAMSNWRWKYPTAWIFTTFCGLADEWHQLHVPGRAGSLQDVIIDSTAAFILITIVYIRDRKKKRRSFIRDE